MENESVLDSLLRGTGWLVAMAVMLPIMWFFLGPPWGVLLWLVVAYLTAGTFIRLAIVVTVTFLIYSVTTTRAHELNGWGAFDVTRGEIYMGQVFPTPQECTANLSRYRPAYGVWHCKYMIVLAPGQLLLPPANAKGNVKCVKNGGTTVCR